MKLTPEQKQELTHAYLSEFSYTGEHKHVDWWLSQIEQLKCTHEHKIKVFLNDEYTICQDCNKFIR